MCTGERSSTSTARNRKETGHERRARPDPARILLLGTGAIAMASDAGGAIKPALQADELVRAVPALERIAALETVAYSNKPGATLTLRDLASLSDVIADGFDRGCQGAVVVRARTPSRNRFRPGTAGAEHAARGRDGRHARRPGAGRERSVQPARGRDRGRLAGRRRTRHAGGPGRRGPCRAARAEDPPPCRRPSARPARDRWERSRKASSACSAGRRRCRPCASRPRDWTKPRSPCCASGWTTTGACCARCRNWAIRARSSKPWARATCRRGWRRTSANWRRECRSC